VLTHGMDLHAWIMYVLLQINSAPPHVENIPSYNTKKISI
jgi:hypothetical protein